MVLSVKRNDTLTKLWLCSILISLLIHAFILTFNRTPNWKLNNTEAKVFDVSFEVLKPEREKQQIVSEPDLPESLVVKPNSFEAEKTHITDEQSIKRGLPEADIKLGINKSKPVETKRAEVKKITKASSAKEVVKSENVEQPVHKLNLKLDSDTLESKFAKKVEGGSSSSAASNNMSNYKAFSRAPGTGAAFIGSSGSADFIPNLPDGDVTLLNTKANQYAVFVRRVATRIFGKIRQAGWDALSYNDLSSINNFCVVEATMDLDGGVGVVILKDSSNSSRFDSVIMDAVRQGLSDQNPPAEAALSDGKIHFVFKSRSWSRTATDRRGIPFERRWLLLGTGLL